MENDIKIKIPYFIRELGDEIIAYILNISHSDANNVLENKFILNVKQKEVLKNYIEYIKNKKYQTLESEDDTKFLSHISLMGISDNKHIFNHFREYCGGILPEIETSDDVEKFLYQLVVEVYPLFLLEYNDYFNIGLFSEIVFVIEMLNEKQKLINALKEDSSLKNLFSKEKEDINIKLKHYSSTGMPGMQLVVFPNVMVKKVYELMVFNREYNIENLEKYTKQIIKMYRDLAENNEVEVPCFVGYENVGLVEDMPSKGILNYDETFLKKIPKHLRPMRNARSLDTYYGFVHKEKINYHISTTRDTALSLSGYEENNKIDKIKKQLALAFAFSNDQKTISIKWKWTYVFDPFSHGSSITWRDRKITINTTLVQYSKQELEEMLIWYRRIREVDDSKIKIATDRVLSAVNNREDYIDSFIDSIIALENMFCHSEKKVKETISKSVALFLRDNDDEIFALYEEVRELYKIRSDVLHGNKILTNEEIKDGLEKSLKILIDCLKKLH